MEVIEIYSNMRERAEKIKLRESQGLRMLHDDFDVTWKPGDEPHGIMTFTDIPPATQPPMKRIIVLKDITTGLTTPYQVLSDEAIPI